MSSRTDAAAGQCPHLPGYDPLSDAQMADPFPLWARAREEVPVFYDDDTSVWHVSRWKDVVQIIGDQESTTVAGSLVAPPVPPSLRDRMPEYPWVNTLANLDPPVHTPRRQIMQLPFQPRHVCPVEPAARGFAQQLVRQLTPEGRMDLPVDFAYPYSLRVFSSILDIPEADFPVMLDGAAAAFQIISGALTAEQELVCAAQVADFTDWLRDFVTTRRQNPGDDYTSLMIAATDAEAISREQADADVSDYLSALVQAGFETTALMLGDVFFVLLEDRSRWEQLVDDPTLAARAVDEALRLKGAVKAVYRTTTKPIVVSGITIPAGERIALLLASANRDSAAYPHADTYSLNRPAAATHLGFGRSTHFCLGAPLARLEARIAIETLVELIPDIAMASDREVTYRRETRLHGPEHLHLTWPL